MSLSENILDVSEATFEREVLMRSHEVPVVVDYWAPWCAPCRQLSPMLERQAIEAGGRFVLAKIDVDENPSLSVRYGVQSIPAVKAFRNGEVVSQFVGAQPEDRVRRFIDEVAPDDVSQSLSEAHTNSGKSSAVWSSRPRATGPRPKRHSVRFLRKKKRSQLPGSGWCKAC